MTNKANRFNEKMLEFDENMRNVIKITSEKGRFHSQVAELVISKWETECASEEHHSANIWNKKKEWYNEYVDNYGSNLVSSKETTPSRQQQQKNQKLRRMTVKDKLDTTAKPESPLFYSDAVKSLSPRLKQRNNTG